MRFSKNYRNSIYRIIAFSMILPVWGLAETKTWTGYGGDNYWSDSLNWSGQTLPQSMDDVILDNGDMPVSYQVILPDAAVTLRTILIRPSPGRNIELILPVTNKITDAFSVTGPGYGIDLNAGAIFRNASGLNSGESMSIADSLIIRDGARYIHQTRAAHANSILQFLSTAPGTEEGVFDFDVPRAAYTISASNRTYGSLELHADANGAEVSYTCTGANPLLIHGNLRIGSNVHLNMNLSGANGNIQVQGDFIQEGGQLNIASGGMNNTIFRIAGDLYQSPVASITETTAGVPFLELNGVRLQEIAMGGQILNQVGFRLNNVYGAELRLPLKIPWILDLHQGIISSSVTNLLILDTAGEILIDSSRQTGIYVNGPMRKLGLFRQDHFLFPVGKDGNLRWLELKSASGNYTVEYIRDNPALIGMNLGAGLDHISKIEYWKVQADGLISNQAKIELSYASDQSGGVSDPNYLNVARFYSASWEDAGHTSITGNSLQGSVLSANTDFTASDYTLASTVNLENPLPLTILEMNVKEISGKPVFTWTVQGPEQAAYFDLLEEDGNRSAAIAHIAALDHQTEYSWMNNADMKSGVYYFRIRMVDIHGKIYSGKIVAFKKETENIRLKWISSGIPGGSGRIMIQSEFPDTWKYDILSIDGRLIRTGMIELKAVQTWLNWGSESLATGIYIFRGLDSKGNMYSLAFKNE